METIIDDFAQAMTAPNRVRFYALLAELLAQRRDDEERRTAGADSEPDVPPHVH